MLKDGLLGVVGKNVGEGMRGHDRKGQETKNYFFKNTHDMNINCDQNLVKFFVLNVEFFR